MAARHGAAGCGTHRGRRICTAVAQPPRAACASAPGSTSPARACCWPFPSMRCPIWRTIWQLREMTCDPKFRKVLVTDGKTGVGQAVVRALIGAGADLVWVGYAEPWKQVPGLAELEALPQVTLVPLDLTDSRSVKQTAAEIGGKVDILINTAEVHRTARHRLAQRRGNGARRDGRQLLRAAAPRAGIRARDARRAARTASRAPPPGSICCRSTRLATIPPHGTFSASKAAALSLSQCLRAEMRPGGVRVINVFPGPIDDEWNQALPPPKLSAGALAKAVVKALQGRRRGCLSGRRRAGVARALAGQPESPRARSESMSRSESAWSQVR